MVSRTAVLLVVASFATTNAASTCDRSGAASRHRPAKQPVVQLMAANAEAKEKIGSWFSQQRSALLSKAQGGGASMDPQRKQAAELMKKRGVANADKAASLLREALKKDPENAEIKMELADALNMVIRIKTNANSLIIEGVQESPAFKKIWKDLGGEALPLATDAKKAFPKSVKALAVHADSFMFYTSSQGIVKQALTGVGKKYVKIAKELYAHPEWDSAVGCAFLGGFYSVAPVSTAAAPRVPAAGTRRAAAAESRLCRARHRALTARARPRAVADRLEGQGGPVPRRRRQARADAAQPLLRGRDLVPAGRVRQVGRLLSQGAEGASVHRRVVH